MNHPFPDDDVALEKLLAQPVKPLPDDGFSLRVLAALPAPQPRKSASASFNKQRVFLCVLGAIAGLWVSWKFGASSFDASAVSGQLNRTWSSIVSVSSDPSWMAMSLIVVCSVIYAFLGDRLRSILGR